MGGVTNGEKYKKPVTVSAVVLDSYLDPNSLVGYQAGGWEVTIKPRRTKDGLEYTRADLKRRYCAPGKHVVRLKAKDYAENEGDSGKIEFTIDVTKNDTPDDNEDASSEPVVIEDNPLGPDELVGEVPPTPALPREGGGSNGGAGAVQISPVAVLDSGFSDDMGHLLGTINVPYDLIDVEAGTEEFYKHKILIIPTDGLSIVSDHPFWRGKLELFAQQGGTIICYGQQSGKNYELLPGSPKGYVVLFDSILPLDGGGVRWG